MVRALLVKLAKRRLVVVGVSLIVVQLILRLQKNAYTIVLQAVRVEEEGNNSQAVILVEKLGCV
jgi:hypothetical protein